MPHLAAIQLSAQPAPRAERLARAAAFIEQAAGQGAQLVVLPELFNTGYQYSDQNYTLAEPLDGPTAAWMHTLSARLKIHLAGSFLRRDGSDIFNTLLLTAPSGDYWSYDKNYPWMWERAYFRPGKSITIADTALGKIGLLICWDVAHPHLWRRYAGQVNLMVVCSCPPAAHNLTLVLPDGKRLPFADLGPAYRRIQRTSGETFGALLRRQSAHLGVPVVNTTAAGLFTSIMPAPAVSLATLALTCPRLWQYLPRAAQVRLEAPYFAETFVAGATGEVLQRVPAEVEGFALAAVDLPAEPLPTQPHQPAYGLSVFTYLFDLFANAMLAPVYRRRRSNYPQTSEV